MIALQLATDCHPERSEGSPSIRHGARCSGSLASLPGNSLISCGLRIQNAEGEFRTENDAGLDRPILDSQFSLCILNSCGFYPRTAVASFRRSPVRGLYPLAANRSPFTIRKAV